MQRARTTVLALALAAPSSALAEAAPPAADEELSHASVAIGAVHVDDTVGPSLGAELETRFSGRLGIVVLVEVARIHSTTHLLAATGVAAHPWGGLSVTAAVGWAHAPGHDALAFRAATGYSFHVGPTSVGPTVAVDRADGATAVVGEVAVGLGF